MTEKTTDPNKIVILLTDEARAAMKRKGPSVRRLTRILLSNEESDMPKSWEARWLAAHILKTCGVTLIHPVKDLPVEKK